MKMIFAPNPTRSMLIAVLCLLLIACGEKDQTRDIADFLERSRSYAQQGQFKAAIIESRNALQAQPDSIDAMVTLAEIYNSLHYTFATIQLLEPVKDNADPRIRLALARAYLTKGKMRSANALLAQPGAPLTAEQQRESRLLQAEIALQEQDIAAAQAILDAMPDDDRAILLLARLDILQQRLSDARARIEPLGRAGNLDAQELLARIEAKTGRLEQAEELLTHLLIALPKTDILTPQRASVLRELMQVVTLQGRSNEALAYAKILADSAPEQAQAEDKLRDAIDSYQKGDIDTSKRLLTELHGTVANKEFTGQFLGILSFMQGDTESAEQMLSQYIDLETAGSKLLHMLAISQLNQGKSQDLIKLLEGAPDKLERDALLQAFHGIALLMEKQTARGMRVLQRSIELDGQQIYAPLALAREHQRQRQPAKALQILQDALKHNPSSRHLQSAMVALHLQNNAPEAALRFIDDALASQPESVSLLVLGGLTHLHAGAYDKATTMLQKVIALEPRNIVATTALAQAALRQKQWTRAREQFTHLIAIAPDNAAAYEGLLATFAGEGRIADGIAMLEQMTHNSDTSGLPFAVMARHRLVSGDVRKAEEYAVQAHKNSPDSKYVIATFVNVMSALARQELAAENFDAARLHCMRALELTPKNPRLLSLLAQVELMSGNSGEAQKIADTLERQVPGNGWSKLLKGDVLARDGKNEEALALYRDAWNSEKTDAAGTRIYRLLHSTRGDSDGFLREWLDAMPNSPGALLTLAMQQQASDAAAAIATYEKLLALQDNNAIALNNLAWLYFERNDARALATAERAHQLAGNDASIADTYGWILVQSGKVSEGIRVLEQALAAAPDSPDIKRHLEQARAGGKAAR